MSLASPLDRPRRGLSVVFVRYDRERYARAWDDFRAHLGTIGVPSIQTVIVDNASPDRSAEQLEESTHVIGGSNRAWEFSAFDEGIDWLRSRGRLCDVTLLATDAFQAYGGDFVELVDEGVLRFCRRHAAAVGWIDSFEEPCRLFGAAYDDWLRTSYLLLPSAALARVLPFAVQLADDELFDSDWRRRWKSQAPVSSGLRRRIDHWLTGSADRVLAEEDTWHSRFELREGTFPFFKAKVRAILREHHLSIRLRAARVRIFDLRVVADRLARGSSPTLNASDEALHGLEALRSRSMVEGGSAIPASAGQRLVFAGDLRRSADAAAARRFSSRVMPLILQRFPAATFEVSAPSAGVRVAVRAGVNNTRVTTPQELAREQPRDMAAMVLPGGGEASAAPPPPLDGSRWATVDSIEMDAPAAGEAAGWQGAVAAAASCCAAIERALASLSARPAAIGSADAADGGREADAGDRVTPEAFETEAHRWRADHRAWRQQNGTLFERREALERSLVKGSTPFVVQGLCYHCGRETPLHVDFEFGGDAAAARPNWRERLVCQVCGLNSKMRGLLHVLREVVVPKPEPRVLVWELEDELTDALRSTFEDVTGVIGDVGLPEAERAPLYDCLVAVDMFEREADLGQAIARSLALLGPGGGMVFSAAFLSDRERNRLLASTESGGTRREFGWAMLQAFRDAGFEDVVAHCFWSRAFGYLGREQVVFVARKPGPDGAPE